VYALLCHAWAIEPSQKEVTSLGDAKSHAAAGKVLNHKKVVSKKKAPAPVDPRAAATQRLVQANNKLSTTMTKNNRGLEHDQKVLLDQVKSANKKAAVAAALKVKTEKRVEATKKEMRSSLADFAQKKAKQAEQHVQDKVKQIEMDRDEKIASAKRVEQAAALKAKRIEQAEMKVENEAVHRAEAKISANAASTQH